MAGLLMTAIGETVEKLGRMYGTIFTTQLLGVAVIIRALMALAGTLVKHHYDHS